MFQSLVNCQIFLTLLAIIRLMNSNDMKTLVAIYVFNSILLPKTTYSTFMDCIVFTKNSYGIELEVSEALLGLSRGLPLLCYSRFTIIMQEILTFEPSLTRMFLLNFLLKPQSLCFRSHGKLLYISTPL